MNVRPWLSLAAFAVVGLALSTGCEGGKESPASPASQESEVQAQLASSPQASPAASSSSSTSLAGPQARVLVSLRPLSVGLAASHHLGAPRGVQRLLANDPGGTPILLRGSRAPLAFRPDPSACTACGTLQTTLPVTALRLQAGSRRGDEEAIAEASYRLDVPVRLRAKQSSVRAGWWDIVFVPEASGSVNVQPSRPWPTELSSSLGSGLSETALSLVEAEAALLPGRAVLLSLLPWQTADAALRLQDLTVGLRDGTVELGLLSGKDFASEPLELPLPAGRDLFLEATSDLLDALGKASVPSAVSAQVREGSGGPERPMDFVRVVDARGREARLSHEPGPRGSRAGSFGKERPVIRPTERPARSRPGESLPHRLRSGSVPGATR